VLAKEINAEFIFMLLRNYIKEQRPCLVDSQTGNKFYEFTKQNDNAPQEDFEKFKGLSRLQKTTIKRLLDLIHKSRVRFGSLDDTDWRIFLEPVFFEMGDGHLPLVEALIERKSVKGTAARFAAVRERAAKDRRRRIGRYVQRDGGTKGEGYRLRT